jgi:hypothetical protein
VFRRVKMNETEKSLVLKFLTEGRDSPSKMRFLVLFGTHTWDDLIFGVTTENTLGKWFVSIIVEGAIAAKKPLEEFLAVPPGAL